MPWLWQAFSQPMKFLETSDTQSSPLLHICTLPWGTVSGVSSADTTLPWAGGRPVGLAVLVPEDDELLDELEEEELELEELLELDELLELELELELVLELDELLEDEFGGESELSPPQAASVSAMTAAAAID